MNSLSFSSFLDRVISYVMGAGALVLLGVLILLPPPMHVLDHLPKTQQSLFALGLLILALAEILYGVIKYSHISKRRHN